MLKSVSADNISVAYGSRTLMQSLSFKVLSGQCMVVAGRNGSGKSSLLRCIAGLSAPSAGTLSVEFSERLCTPTQLIQENAPPGYCAPDLNLYAELSGRENLTFLARLSGVHTKKVDELLCVVGLCGESAGRLVAHYSSGMQQRLRIAASLIQSPEFIVWDEPTATLDGSGRDLVDQLIFEYVAKNGVVIIATNDASETERWGDLVVEIGTL